MEVKAEPEFAKIFQEGRAHKSRIICNLHVILTQNFSLEPEKRRISCDRQCSGSDEEKHYCNIGACNSPTEPPIETATIATYGVTSTSSYENPTGGDDCITQTTFHTPLCSQPYDAIFQYSRGM